jgi:RNA polymerase sigma-70 factor (ECF subfamily)
MDSLIRRAQAGDTRAFERLYRANAGRVYALCLRLAGDRGRAEELAQDAFVRAWEKLGTFRGDAAFSTWIHRIAVNAFLMSARSEKRRETRLRLVGDTVEVAEGTSGATVRSPDAVIDLERAIGALPEGARTIFVLHDIEGYGHEEIAELMGIAPGTSKSQLHRARKLLREALEL